jgi:hypothetical protein
MQVVPGIEDEETTQKLRKKSYSMNNLELLAMMNAQDIEDNGNC